MAEQPGTSTPERTVAVPEMSPAKATGLAVLLAAVFGLLDQWSKWIILNDVMNPPQVIEVTGFFNLVLVYNRGVSFGLFGGTGDAEMRVLFLSVLAVAIVLWVFWWLWKEPRALMVWSVGLIAGGAMGNVYDRWTQPGVVDFLDFHLSGYHWPAFNVADSLVFIGVALILIDGLFSGSAQGKKDQK
ncbi:signal peptidase II [Kiloniella sp. b19]|uniref:signal peptidase II n=1 Tax=Kiloniella sp. GXU_MW_B19 TaxID=3141326 RepID=UPI0031CE3BA1